MTKYWHPESEPPLRRYAACGPPYQVSPEHHRYQPEGLRRSTRSYTLPVQEPQLHDSDPDSERDNKESRRRIPVACGRCRKRKIRCSGPQNDASCVNCKNAGSSECQFNRVSSEEVAFKSSVEFGYNTELARAVHVRGSSQPNYRPPTPSYNYGPTAMATNLPMSYRAHPASDYQYDVKSPCQLPSFTADYNEDGLDYALSGSAYPMYPQEVVGGLSSYSSYGSNRVWIPATPQARNSINGFYFGTSVAAYSPSQTSFNSQAYGPRSSVSSELNNFTFSDMTSSLPTPESTATHTRTLPMLPSRSNSILAPLHRMASELSYNSHMMNTNGGQPLAGTQLMTTGHSAPMSYLPQQASADSIDGFDCNSLAGSLTQQQQDLYSANDNWTLPPMTSESTLPTHNSSTDLYYSHRNDSSRKLHQSGQSGVNDTLVSRHNASPDLYSCNSGERSRKDSLSEQSSQSSTNGTANSSHNSSSEVYYSHCNDPTRKASQSGNAYQVPYSQEKLLVPRSSSMNSMDTPRIARHRPSAGNLQAAL